MNERQPKAEWNTKENKKWMKSNQKVNEWQPKSKLKKSKRWTKVNQKENKRQQKGK